MNRLLSFLFVCLINISFAVASTFSLSVEVTPNGAGALNISGGTYEEGSTVYLRSYNNTGYVFKGWYDGETFLSSSSNFKYTMPAKDVLVKAKYEYDPTVPGNPSMPDTTTYYSFHTIISPHGAGTLNSNSARYAAGTTVSLHTYNNTGYKFVGWQDENGLNLSTSTSFNYTMPNHDVTLTALYSYDPTVPANPDTMATRYTVTVMSKPMGGGSFNTSRATTEEGGNVRLYAYTNTGYQFLHWENEQGEIISSEQNFYYVMPHGNTKIFGVFDYNPAPPSNPNKNYWNKELGEVIVDDFTPGSLNSAVSYAISGSNRSDVTMITVAGKINDNDFGIANNYTNCTLLDLSRVTGITEVPSYAFDYTNLETVYLPATIEKIGTRAFAECSELSSLTIYAMTPPTLGNNVFQGVAEGLVVYVPAAAIAQYQDVEVWSKFTLLPIQEDIRNISISLPDNANAADYAQMWLELTNTKSGQRMHYVMTDRRTYTFANIIRNTSWNVTLRNERGDIFGNIYNVEVKDEDVSVTFNSLSKPQTVVLSVLTPEGKDVTNQTQIIWTDAKGNYLSQGFSLAGLPTGYQATYHIMLSQELAMAYNAPQSADYVLTDSDNKITCLLYAIPKVKISGKVKDAQTGLPLSGTAISVSQTFGGKYSKTLNAKTDGNGVFTLDIANVPTSVAFAASDYISQTVNCDSLLTGAAEVTLPDVSLKTITGATITLDFTYTSCDGETQNWYSDYQNVNYELFNVTRNKAVSQYNVQYPQMVLLEEIADGDVLKLTATSRTNAFMPVTTTTTIAEQKAEATFAVMELGKIQASFASTGNASVVGSLYDGTGKLIKTYDYSNALLTISDLADGKYTLVSMGSSRLFNTIYDLSQLPQTGLAEGTDYIQNGVEVKSGKVLTVSIDEVPTLDENKLYYTGDNTSFTVNKPSIVAGNYLTLTGRIDFKPAYATSVSNVQMIVDLPESCEFVENSVMVGNSTSSYTVNGNKITIPMARYTDRVRFCIIPTLGGEYAPSALVQFDLNGETVTQPIGSANYTAKDLSISVPSTVAKTTIPVSGTAIGKSEIKIYDNEVLIGQTKSLANGMWTISCDLNQPYNLSIHKIYAQVTTNQGLELQSEIKTVQYDKYAVEVSKVEMTNTAHSSESLNPCQYTTVFDFQNSQSSIPAYWYWPSYPDFTFVVNFTNNDTTIISNVVLHVFTTSDAVINLYPVYDKKLDAYVASAKFSSNALPETVSVSFDTNTNIYGDAQQISDAFNSANNMKKDVQDGNVINLLEKLDNVDDEIQENDIVKELYERLGVQIKTIEINDFETQLKNFENDLTFPEIPLVLSDSSLDITSESEHCQIFVSSYMENKENININDFMPSELDDGSIVYFRASDKFYEFINLKEDAFIRLHISSNNNTLSVRRISGMDALQVFVTAFDNYETIIQGLNVDINTHRLELLSKINGSIARHISKLNEVESLLEWMRSNDTAAKYVLTYKSLISQRRAILNTLAPFKTALRTIGAVFKAINFWSTYQDAVYAGESLREWIEIISTIEGIDCPGMNELAQEALIYAKSVGTGYAATLAAEVATLSSLKTSLSCGVASAITLAIGDFAIIQGGINKINDIRWKSRIRNKIPVLKCKPDAPNPPKPHEPRAPHVMDPSGYVYECVTSNRIEGVTATAYYMEMVEDMYGDLHENIVKWDASEYAQKNPLFTNEHGMYAWDVPNGLWQVKFEKEGYETTYSEWLPVPPPQLDVNIAMKQNRQPEVKSARAYEDGVEVEFDKYMMPELLTTENIMVMQNGTAVEGSVELLNEEVSYEGEEETFASKIRFNAALPFTEQEVTLLVSNRVKSYAGIRMQDDYQQTFAIEQEIKQIVCDSVVKVGYGSASAFVVSVLPASASKGKTLTVKTSSPMILGVETEQVTVGNDGKAEIVVSGELPGTAALTFSVEGTDKTAMTIANVEQSAIKTVATPKASIASGTVVEKGTAITLTCETEGATIYYTLDGSCPCDKNRKIYDGTPIIANNDFTLKIMAEADGMTESEIAEYQYYVITTLTLNLQKGWNWVSSNLSEASHQDAKTFLEPIKDVTERFVGQFHELVNDPNLGLTGALEKISPTDCYKILVSQATDNTWKGHGCRADNTPIRLNKGWNWIGYVPISSTSVKDALAGITPDENDIVKTQDDFAIFSGGKWSGTLTTMNQGVGYMYYSAKDATFTYPLTNAFVAEPAEVPQYKAVASPWQLNPNAYPDNKTIVADVYDYSGKALEGVYTIGAFVGEECRGIGTYTEGHVYMTVHGTISNNETITFKAYENATANERSIKETLTLDGMHTGTPTSPYLLHVSSATDIKGVNTISLNIHPNLVRYTMYINGDTECIKEIKIFAPNGQAVLYSKGYNDTGIDVSSLASGVYVVALHTKKGYQYKKIIIQK